MPLILSDEQPMLDEAADGFLSEHAPIAHLRKLRDSHDPDGVSRDLWRSFGEMGFAGVLIPEDHGGSGLGAVEAGVVAEALGRTLTPSPFLASGVLAADGPEGRVGRAAGGLAAEDRGGRGHGLAGRGRGPASTRPHRIRTTRRALRQRLQAERSQGLRAGRPCRRRPDRGGAHLGRGHGRPDPVPGRPEDGGAARSSAP